MHLFIRLNACVLRHGVKKLVYIIEAMKSRYEKVLGRKDIEILHNGAESKYFNIPAPQNITFSKENPF